MYYANFALSAVTAARIVRGFQKTAGENNDATVKRACDTRAFYAAAARQDALRNLELGRRY